MIAIAILVSINLPIAQVVFLLMSWCMDTGVGVMIRVLRLILVMELWFACCVQIIYKDVTLALRIIIVLVV